MTACGGGEKSFIINNSSTEDGVEKFIIDGGVPLRGRVKISGAKNAALPLLAASLLIREPFLLQNVPRVRDIDTMADLLRHLGVQIQWKNSGQLEIDASWVNETVVPYEIVRKMRASIYILGPLLLRRGQARVSLPGGCAFGPRPVDFHLTGLKKLGAKIELQGGYIIGKVNHLQGTEIVFDKKSVGATAHLLMAATLIPGETLLLNVALEPEVTTLANFLNQAGAQIEGIGTEKIQIHGVDSLHSPGEYKIIPDRIEATTFALAAFLTGGEVHVEGVHPEHFTIPLDKLRLAGASILEENQSILSSRTPSISAVSPTT